MIVTKAALFSASSVLSFFWGGGGDFNVTVEVSSHLTL